MVIATVKLYFKETIKYCCFKFGNFGHLKDKNTYDRSDTIIVLHGLYQQWKGDEIKISESMDICYDHNEYDDKMMKMLRKWIPCIHKMKLVLGGGLHVH